MERKQEFNKFVYESETVSSPVMLTYFSATSHRLPASANRFKHYNLRQSTG